MKVSLPKIVPIKKKVSIARLLLFRCQCSWSPQSQKNIVCFVLSILKNQLDFVVGFDVITLCERGVFKKK